jgi:hypothetical protein
MKKILDGPKGGLKFALMVVSVSFTIGIFAGCLLAAQVGGGGTDSLTVYLKNYLVAVESGKSEAPSVLPLIWEVFRWPILAVFLGLTPLGIVAIPALFLLRGFLLSFSIGSLYRMLAAKGLLLAFYISGISGFIIIPVLFLLGVQSMMAARMLSGRGNPYGKRYFVRLGICAVALIVCVILERFVVPPLLLVSAASMAG